ncbi:PEGA domain-containing protein [Methanoregula sp. PtaU1.Bin006]|nr:PEGA domain-containing protein [Methanoregula sp. PtaU1.Bin006]
MVLLILVTHTGTASAADTGVPAAANLTDTATPAVTGAETIRTGGSVYFTTDPKGAMIWVDDAELGTGDFTYFFDKTGTYRVRAWKKGYENFTGQVTVSKGQRVIFEAVLTPVSHTISSEITTAGTATTITTLPRSTITLPTPWPTSPQSSPATTVIFAAVVLAIGLAATRRG